MVIFWLKETLLLAPAFVQSHWRIPFRAVVGMSSESLPPGPDESRGFCVLGVHQTTGSAGSKFIPEWIEQAHSIEESLTSGSRPVSEMGLDRRLVDRLISNGIQQFFPVQVAAIEQLVGQLEVAGRDGGCRPRDLCFAAPTGSGKTLAFVLPVLHLIGRQRLVRPLRSVRGLVVLPTVDLAQQVFGVLSDYANAVEVRVALCIGQRPINGERDQLVRRTCRGQTSSLVDVVVCTPGRLVEHIEQTAGFSLRELRFVVIDEADRVVGEMRRDWLRVVERAAPSSLRSDLDSLTVGPFPFQRLLFSATLTKNTEVLEELNLFRPVMFSASGALLRASLAKASVHVPTSLREFYLPIAPSLKPLAVLYMLTELGYRQVLCFVKSLVNTHRLCLVLQRCLEQVGMNKTDHLVAEMDAEIPAARRRRLLSRFRRGQVIMLVCSDMMSRGIDVTGVQCVLSYDAPTHLETYVHRAGRTARAGSSGTSVVLVEPDRLQDLKRVVGKAAAKRFQELLLDDVVVSRLRSVYETALEQVRDHVVRAAKRKSTASKPADSGRSTEADCKKNRSQSFSS